jgi:hypothetical protein
VIDEVDAFLARTLIANVAVDPAREDARELRLVGPLRSSTIASLTGAPNRGVPRAGSEA